MVGRLDELAGLRSVVERCADQRVSLVLVGGVAGVGKSRLVTEAARWAEGRGVVVAEGACLPLGSSLPYGPFVELLGYETFASDDATGRPALFRAAADALVDRAGNGPLLVVLEDLHWADASTCDLLVFCARMLADRPIVLVGTYRVDDAGPGSPFGRLLADVGTAPWLRRLELSVLTQAETAEQLAGIRGTRPSAELVDRVYARSGGNPYFAEELLAADPVAQRLPSSVRSAVLSRLEQLGEPARIVARALAVAGPRVHRQLLLATCDLDADDIDAGVATLTRSALVIGTGAGYEFRHALAHESILGALGPAERTAAHRRVAELLTERPDLASTTSRAGAATERAHHWAAAGEPARALAETVVAADAAHAVPAPAEELVELERALDLWNRVAEPSAVAGIDRLTLLERTGDAAVAAGRHERAIRLLARVRDGLATAEQPHRLATVLVQLARAQREIGRVEHAKATIDEAARILPVDEASPALAQVLARQAHLDMTLELFEEGIPVARRAIAVAEVTGTAAAEGVARLALGGCLIAWRGDDDEGVTEMRRGFELIQRHGDLRIQVVAAYNSALYLQYLNRFDDALSVIGDLRERLSLLGVGPSDIGLLAAIQASVLVRLGRLDAAARVLRDVEPASGLYDSFRRIAEIELALARGDLARARTVWDDLVGDQLSQEPQGREWNAYLGVQLHAGEGRWDEARRWCLGGLDELDASDPYPVHICAHGLRAEADRFEAGLADEGAEAAVAAYLTALDRFLAEEAVRRSRPRPDTTCRAALARADAARARGADDPALWRAAVEAADASVEPWPQAYARYREGVAVLGAGGSPGAAVSSLAEARRIAEEIGAERLGEEIDAAAERFRLRLDGRPSPVDPLGRYHLTRREREVLALVAAGASNREIAATLFISDKTASVHVTNILRKLEVSTRTQAAAIAYRAGVRVPTAAAD